MAKQAKETPLMKQYNQIKAKYPDALLLFRVGDFYETFGADAVKASKILGIIQTKRGAGSTSETELAGFPHHSLNTYLPKLVKAGCRVAICDQLEDPKMAKKIVKRGVTELVTPGVALNDDVLEQKKNNYLAAIVQGKKQWGIAFLDISTGDFLMSEGNLDYLNQLLQKFSPAEVLAPKPLKSTFAQLFNENLNRFFLEDWIFQERFGRDLLQQHFGTSNLKGSVWERRWKGLSVGGLSCITFQKISTTNYNILLVYKNCTCTDFVGIDRFTARNLELLYPSNPGGVALIDVIDFTSTAMGGRLLRQWVSFPLKSIEKIEARHSIVRAYLNDTICREKIAQHLKKVGDVERLMAKIATQKISPRELILLQQSLSESEEIKSLLESNAAKELKNIADQLPACQNIQSTIGTTLKEEAPVSTTKGNFIADGFSAELDELRALLHSGKSHLDEMLERESKTTQIPRSKLPLTMFLAIILKYAIPIEIKYLKIGQENKH